MVEEINLTKTGSNVCRRNMKIHNFVEDSKEEYRRSIFCRRCGQVAWHYNYSYEINMEIQAKLKECVESGAELLENK